MADDQSQSNDNLASQLSQLAELYEDGLLTDEEYQKAKAKLLDMPSDEYENVSLGEILDDVGIDIDTDEQLEKYKKQPMGRDVSVPIDRVEKFFEFIFRIRRTNVDFDTTNIDKLAARFRRHRFHFSR
jgi:hypothetical protein